MNDVCIRQSASSAAGNSVSVAGSSGAPARESAGGNGMPEPTSPSKLANGMRCEQADQCDAGSCKNVMNGFGICCDARADCCGTPADCPDGYRRSPVCTDANACRGTETIAVCESNLCSSRVQASDAACNGMKGSSCGFYRDVTCMAGRNNGCLTACSGPADCDENAFCDDGQCVEKREVGGTCTEPSHCKNNNCVKGVCCAADADCCSQPADCTRDLEPRCDDADQCQGTRKSTACENGVCKYGERIDDDSACVAGIPGSGGCGIYRDLGCNGKVFQECYRECFTIDPEYYCDRGYDCVGRTCVPLGSTAGAGGSG